MGRFLIIGLTTELAFRKKEAEQQFDTLESAKEFIERHHAPSEVFNMQESEDCISYSIKPELLEKELTSFLKEFYDTRFQPDDYNFRLKDDILNDISKCESAASILELAEAKEHECFQQDSYWDPYYIRNKKWGYMKLYTSGITLSIDGKIIMEGYGSLFAFFQDLIVEKFHSYQLARAIRVTISG